MRGRKPVPTAIKKLNGNPGKRKLNNAEPQYDDKLPTCPKGLTGEARKEWRRIVKLMGPTGSLHEIDRAALAAYCDAYARWLDAKARVEKSSAVLRNGESGRFYQNPYISIANKAIEQMIKIASEFGMTPASRTRIKIQEPPKVDPLELELFGQDVVLGS